MLPNLPVLDLLCTVLSFWLHDVFGHRCSECVALGGASWLLLCMPEVESWYGLSLCWCTNVVWKHSSFTQTQSPVGATGCLSWRWHLSMALSCSVVGLPERARLVGFVLHSVGWSGFVYSLSLAGTLRNIALKKKILILKYLVFKLRRLQRSLTTCGRNTARGISKMRASWNMSVGGKCTWGSSMREKKNWRRLQETFFQLSLRNRKVISVKSFSVLKAQSLLFFLRLTMWGLVTFALITDAVYLGEGIK